MYDTRVGLFYLLVILINTSTFYRAVHWAESIGVTYTEHTATTLFNRVVCSRHFSETDFKTKERKGLNWSAVPSLDGSITSAHSDSQSNYPSSAQLSYPSSILSTIRLLPENELTQLSPQKDLKFLQPSKTYQRKSTGLCPSSFAKEHIPVPPTPDIYYCFHIACHCISLFSSEITEVAHK